MGCQLNAGLQRSISVFLPPFRIQEKKEHLQPSPSYQPKRFNYVLGGPGIVACSPCKKPTRKEICNPTNAIAVSGINN